MGSSDECIHDGISGCVGLEGDLSIGADSILAELHIDRIDLCRNIVLQRINDVRFQFAFGKLDSRRAAFVSRRLSGFLNGVDFLLQRPGGLLRHAFGMRRTFGRDGVKRNHSANADYSQAGQDYKNNLFHITE